MCGDLGEGFVVEMNLLLFLDRVLVGVIWDGFVLGFRWIFRILVVVIFDRILFLNNEFFWVVCLDVVCSCGFVGGDKWIESGLMLIFFKYCWVFVIEMLLEIMFVCWFIMVVVVVVVWLSFVVFGCCVGGSVVVVGFVVLFWFEVVVLVK